MNSDQLRQMHVEIESYGFCETHSGCRLKFAASRTATLHYCLMGVGKMNLADGTQIPMQSGTLILLPRGLVHAFEVGDEITSEIDGNSFNSGRELSLYRAGGGDDDPLVVTCGDIILGNASVSDLSSWLIDPVISNSPGGGPFDEGLRSILGDLRIGRPISVALMETLLKAKLIQLLETRPDRTDTAPAGLRLTDDRKLAAAINLISFDPAANLTIQRLCLAAGLSRTLLFERFHTNFGISPARFILNARLGNAARLLRTSDRTIGDIARQTGFSSGSHFNRQFSRKYRTTPSGFRKGRKS